MARSRTILLLFTIIPLVVSQCTKETATAYFRRSVYDFSVKLLSRLNDDTDGHFVSSTLSPWNLLSILALGAADNTLAEIQHVARLHPHDCFNRKFLELVKDVTASDSQVTVERSASLFLDNTMGLKDDFRNTLTESRVCQITPVSFDDFDVAAAEINNYVNQATHGVIEEVVGANDLEGVYLMLVDALYFKGAWRNAFSTEETEVSTFYDSHNQPIGDVNLMYISSKFNTTAVKQIKANVLELPYGDNGRVSMLVFLPFNGVKVQQVVESLGKISLGSIFYLFSKYGPTTVSVQIPRFKISSDTDNLKELLTDMGLADMFNEARAKFPEISEYAIHVSSFIQKADIEVTEEGTVAAAATEAGATFRFLPMEFVANKPFFFMVVDRETQVALFSGAYSKPSVY